MHPRYSPVEWSFNTNIYEVNVRQYTEEGTFRAFAREMPRLRKMGIDVLWFMPITPISKKLRIGSLGSYYACSDYTDINPEFGTIQDFRELVQQAHALGFKVIIDWVANHTGWDHKWTISNPGYYKKNVAGEFYDSNNWHDVIDLNYYDHGMRRAMIDAMKFWVVESDIDGFRCDMAHLVPLDFWRQARNAMDAVKPLFWLAETEHASYHAVFDASYAWNWMHQTETFCKGKINLPALLDVLKNYELNFPPNALKLYFTTNHDENSWNGTEYEKYEEAALPFAVFSCTWNGIPLIYSGQEMPNMKRIKFFEKDPIEWNGNYELEDFYRKLLNLRNRNPALRGGDTNAIAMIINAGDPNHVFAYLRKLLEKEVLVILNLSAIPQEVDFQDQHVRGVFNDVFREIKTEFDNSTVLQILPWEYLVFEKT